MGPNDTVIARILLDDQTHLGFNSYARNVERAKKTSEAFRQNAIDKVTQGLENQFKALTKTAREMDVLQAAMYGASQAQIDHINKLHDSIDAHNRATVAAEEKRRADEQAALASQKMESAIERITQDLQFQANTVDMTADEIQIYRLQMMGASAAQIDAVKKVQQATAAMRAQGKAAGTLHGQLRLMRGGLGQIGHQVQDVAVQLQMGQNALLVLGQQGSQVASLFGQNGALIGAVLAVGAAVGTYLAPELFKTTNHLEELKKVGEETKKFLEIDFVTGVAALTDELSKLAEKSEDLARATLQVKLVTAMNTLQSATENVRKEFTAIIPSTLNTDINTSVDEFTLLANKLGLNREELIELNNKFISLASGTGATIHEVAAFSQQLTNQSIASKKQTTEFVALNQKLQEFAVAERETKDIINTLSAALELNSFKKDEANTASKEAAKKADEHKVKLDNLVEALSLEKLALQEGSRAVYLYNLSKQDLTPTEIKQVMALYDNVAALREEQAELKKTQEVEAAAEKAKDSHKQKVSGMTVALLEQIVALTQGEEAAQRMRLASQGLSEAEIDQQIALQATIDKLVAEKTASDKADDALKAQKETRDKFVESVTEQANALGKSALQLMIDQAAIYGVSAELEAAFERIRKFEADKEAAAAKSQSISDVESIRQGLMTEEEVLLDSHNRKQDMLATALSTQAITVEEFLDLQLKLYKDFEDKKANLTKKGAEQEILTGSKLTGHMLGQLGEQFAGVKAVNKKMFAAQKAYKIANAIQNTYDAANNALSSPYPWPLPQVFAATAIAAGLANVAAIKSTSFDGGGFTGLGSRSGGMDGKGGFPAILHPNETVVDHTKGQGQGITIINNVDARGAGPEVDIKIQQAMQMTSQQTIATVQDLMRRRRFA